MTPSTELLEEKAASSGPLPETAAKFVVKEHITTKNPQVSILDISEDFQRFFAPLVEPAEPLITLACLSLQGKDKLRDGMVFSRLGGEQKAQSSVCSMYALMAQQAHCEPGELVVDGNANVFYAVGVDEHLHAIALHAAVSKQKKGWRIFVYPIVYVAYENFINQYWEKGCKIYYPAPLLS